MSSPLVDTRDNATKSTSQTSGLPLPVVQSTGAVVHWKLPNPRRTLVTSPWARFKRHNKRPTTDPLVPANRPDLVSVEGEKQSTRRSIGDVDSDLISSGTVDEVVVDRSWLTDDRKSSLDLDQDSDVVSIKSYHSQPGLSTSISKRATGHTLRSCIWFYLVEFFSSRFSDPEIEADYQRDMCGEFTPLKFWTSLFFIANWVLEIAFLSRPVVWADKIFYFGVRGFGPCEATAIDLLARLLLC